MKELKELKEQNKIGKKIDILIEDLTCKACNGRGEVNGENFGVMECSECGGDGHNLKDERFIGTRIEKILQLPPSK
jgi:DnaJ-class molecular chaperone